MSRKGMEIARTFGEQLPRFDNLSEAEPELMRVRDSLLDKLKHAAVSAGVELDESGDSLKILERWYFELIQSGGFESVGLTRDVFERGISMYLGAVIVRNIDGFNWVVQEFVFAPGRYEIGVRRRGFTMMLMRGSNLEAVPNNKRHQSLFRRFQQLKR